jgi:hypothetical protein
MAGYPLGSLSKGLLIMELSDQVDHYIRDFPYQETFNYVARYTGGDPSMLNAWLPGSEPVLVAAGEDKVVRTNNDTFYKMAFIILDHGPVVLHSDTPSNDRFVSFQLMDDRNVNYRNVVHPSGSYTLFRGQRPANVEGEAIEAPSSLSVVIVRVEVKDKDDPADQSAAEEVFRGLRIEGPSIDVFPSVGLLSKYPSDVTEEATRALDEAFQSLPFLETVVGPGKQPGLDVPYLNHSAGTKGAWGAPGPEHSSYETIFTDADGQILDGSKGDYTLTTSTPPVGAFWSVTVYDTDRGGFFHPNADNRYHINNTTALPNSDGTYTFNFKTACGPDDLNCIETPAGRFDYIARYYLPNDEIINGTWQMPRAKRA